MTTFDWDFSPPKSPPLGDHDVPVLSGHLRGKRVALLVCGGIAAMKTPLLARALRRRGAEVVAFCSDEALRYVGREALEWATCNALVTQLTWRAEHLSDSAPFDCYLVAPATYNTIGKMAAGIADSVVTAALASALGRMEQGRTQVLVAPTMHGSMHHEVLVRNCQLLGQQGVRFVTPRDDYGKHNLPEEELLVAAVCRALSRSPLRGQEVLVTGGPAAAAVHEELLLRGADSTFLLEEGPWRPASWMPVEVAPTAEAFKKWVLAHAARGQVVGVVAAGPAADLVRAEAPGAFLVSWTQPEGASQDCSVVGPGGEVRAEGKSAIAAAIADLLERRLPQQ